MDAIYKKYCKCVYNFLYKLTNDIELSEELTQETFYTAIKKINTLKDKIQENDLEFNLFLLEN